MSSIRLDSISKSYDGEHFAVNKFSLSVADGEFMVLLGPSGCGKSTVLRMMAGLEEITAGELYFNEVFANYIGARDRGVAMVFQSGALYPNRTVRGNITFPLQMAGEKPEEANEKAHQLAGVLGIQQTLDRLPQTLSGGQRQRVAIGRAIVRQPSAFLMDEPLSNLDAAMRTELRQEIGAMTRDLGITTVYVTHDQVEALTLADRIAVMRDGRLEDVGTPAEVFDDPATAFVAGFLGTPRINLLSSSVRAEGGRVSLVLGGGQALHLDPDDRRTTLLLRRGGEEIVIGVRSDALTLDGEAQPNRVSGRLRTLEYHGHQWIAYVETGIEMVNPDLVGRLKPERISTHSRRSFWRRAARATKRSGILHRRDQTRAALPETSAPTHRRADLVVELHSSTPHVPGDQVSFAVDMTRVYLFDRHGHRIDRVAR
ncbi:ABC transporter ATP-binding protein [Kribbella albertanoniae]|uniref:ABC transporter ATP-binding protein n=1 Tax=Kribbella albertanoniae TaxID=1266829 RepID=A0A4R4PI25_9ACTN|nr:ABC transporter ATP-binding protein [Kribbella albertanoniae]TDC21618.1 ABC transporter ATP-binding protein [Kribbella albertanoniae]